MDISIVTDQGAPEQQLDAADNATIKALITIADLQAALRALRDGLVHPNAGSEQVLAAAYEAEDMAATLTNLRFTLEHAAGTMMLADQAERLAAAVSA